MSNSDIECYDLLNINNYVNYVKRRSNNIIKKLDFFEYFCFEQPFKVEINTFFKNNEINLNKYAIYIYNKIISYDYPIDKTNLILLYFSNYENFHYFITLSNNGLDLRLKRQDLDFYFD